MDPLGVFVRFGDEFSRRCSAATTVEVVAATAAQVVFPEGDSKGESPLGLQLVGSDLRTHTIISE